MAYSANLGSHQQIMIANQGNQTLITLQSSTPGQQQSQTSGFTTGNWNKPPHLYQSDSGFILEINSDGKEHFILIQANSIGVEFSDRKIKNTITSKDYTYTISL